ncbi:MAG TPA: Fic family protein [Actinokineospora sp.]|nr:Fic family protein [Actinokineospora sp.]
MTQDPYTDPSTGVLRNLLGIEDHETLIAAERDIAFQREEGLRRRPMPGEFDAKHLLAYHRRLFGDVYEWAGQPRLVDIARVDAPFAHWRYIDRCLADLFGGLRAEDLLIDHRRPEFVARFTYYFAEINVVHPFREGNGRTQRAFFRHLAAHAGWELDITHLVGPDFVDGCKAGMVGELGLLTDLFDRAIG